MSNTTVEPRPAATLVLIRETSTQPLQTLMVKRHQDIAFAGGAFVFPGGRVDSADHLVAARDGDDAFKIAAIRETFEESGILLANHAATGLAVTREIADRVIAQYRRAICQGEVSFAEMLQNENLVTATERLVPYARWITPPGRSKRFDTHFFIADYREDQSANHDGGEITETIWISPLDLIAAARAGQHKVVFATRLNVERLAAFSSVADALNTIRATPVITVRPETIITAEGKMVRIPIEAGYGGELFVSNDPASI